MASGRCAAGNQAVGFADSVKAPRPTAVPCHVLAPMGLPDSVFEPRDEVLPSVQRIYRAAFPAY